VRKYLAPMFVAMLLLAACKSTSDQSTTGTSAPPTTVAPTDTRAPGVTSNTIQVGITYPDLSSLEDILHINNGDYAKAYQAMIDEINAKGGIHGRKLVATIIGINPTQQSAADQACTKLTQDVKVFVTVGFFLNDNVLCYVNTNQTAVIGGAMTAARLAQAKAPWYSTDASDRLEIQVVEKLAASGKLDGKVAVVAAAGDKGLATQAEAALTKAGIKPVATAILDAPTNDATATFAQAGTISQKFQSAGADKVLLVGQAIGGSYLPGLAKTSYRPQLLFSNQASATTYGAAKGADLSVLTNAVTGGTYGPADAQYNLGDPTKQCLDAQRAAGLVIKLPSSVPAGQPNQFSASSNACTQMTLLFAILQKVGSTLNYGTFAAAGNSLGKIVLPAFPDAWDFGAAPNSDGNPPLYVFAWDPAQKQFNLEKS